MKKVILDTNYCSGGMRPKPMDTDFVSEEFKLALVKYKTMDELIKANPKYYFDKYGNFNTGVTTDSGYDKDSHIPPNTFPYLGHTIHIKYDPTDGVPTNTFYYDIIDY